jgi:hypothetical protein
MRPVRVIPEDVIAEEMIRFEIIVEGPTPSGPRRQLVPELRMPGVGNKRVRLCAVMVLVMGCLAGSSAVAGANCNDDCKNEYVSGLSDCRAQYDQSKDLQDLEECLADSRSEYDDCIDDCTDLGAGGVMACSSAIGVELTSFYGSTSTGKPPLLSGRAPAFKASGQCRSK